MMRRIRSRVAFLVAVIALIVPGPARALEEIVITQPVDSLSFFPVYVARSLKYFEDEGLSVRVLSSAGGGPHLQAVLAGKAQFTASPGTYQLNALNSLDYIHGHSLDEIVKTVEPFFATRVKPDLLKASVETVKAATVRDGYLTEDEVATTVQLLRESGKEMPSFTVKDVFSDRFLNGLK